MAYIDQFKILTEAVKNIYLFLLELRLRIKIMPQAEFMQLINELTAEQRIYALYFRLF